MVNSENAFIMITTIFTIFALLGVIYKFVVKFVVPLEKINENLTNLNNRFSKVEEKVEKLEKDFIEKYSDLRKDYEK